jgi:ubiquinone/menaquinone biosynthesis C-methylase UbiE
MNTIIGKPSQHDAYADTYDDQVRECGCYLAEVTFGLCYEYLQPGQLLLDAGIGSGLSSMLFAKAGLVVHGFDFSPAMLEVCRSKGTAQDLRQHDILEIPWPYPDRTYDHLVCCGVLHFIQDLDMIFSEAARVIKKGGLFIFTSKLPGISLPSHQKYQRLDVDGFEVFSHSPTHLEGLFDTFNMNLLKNQHCLVGTDLFATWLASTG